MKLSYRGVNYEVEASMLEVTEGEIGGQYRGQPWRFHYVRHMPKPQTVHTLKYRGIPYRTDHSPVEDSRTAAQSTTSIPRRIPTSHRQREILDELKSNHIRNIQRSLEHRLAVAKAKGDEQLIRMLEAESRDMALPHY